MLKVRGNVGVCAFVLIEMKLIEIGLFLWHELGLDGELKHEIKTMSAAQS